VEVANSGTATASDTDPRQGNKYYTNKELSSGSLLPIISMMQATNARE
jgi:hypothetical protein